MSKSEQLQPASSNSRLSAHLVCTLSKISFDRLTLIGDLNLDATKYLADYLSTSEYFDLFDYGSDRFRARAFTDKFYIEYDKVKAETFKNRNLRIEFNPNKISDFERDVIKDVFIKKMKNIGFTRIDLAFDFELDLSDFYAIIDSSLKKTLIFGRNGKVETKYFGSRESDRYIRIYDKKRERLDNADVLLDVEDFWRIEFELKGKFIDQWENCFQDLHFIKPKIKTVESISERAMLNLLLQDESEWGNLHRNSKKKYKKMLLEISDVDLLDVMEKRFSEEKERLKNELNYYINVI